MMLKGKFLRWKVSSVLLGKRGGQLLIALVRTEAARLKQKQSSAVDVSSVESKV